MSENFWARGYFASTIELDEEMVSEHIRNQEEAGEHYDQLNLTSDDAFGSASFCPFDGLTNISYRLCRR